MKKFRFLIVILAFLFATFAVIGCVDDDSSSTGSDTSQSTGSDTGSTGGDSSGEDPVERLVLGVAYGGEEVANNEIVIDYKNVAGGISFYSVKGETHEDVSLDLTEIKVANETLAADNYEYDGGILDFTAEYLKTLSLNSKYAVTAVFGEEKAEFGLTMTDNEAPAVVFVTDGVIKSVYVSGAKVTLPTATKAASSIQNVTVEYSLKNAAGEACSYENNEYTATATGKYTYTAVIYKNGEKSSEKSVSFLVIDPAKTNFADKDVVSVLGGKYNDEKGAAEFKGTASLSDITVDTKFTRVRISYSGAGSVSFDGTETPLASADGFAVQRLTVKDFNTIVVKSENGLYIDSLTISELSAFNEADIASYNFASKDNMKYWSFNTQYGIPSYDDEKGGITFPANGNSWVYALREGVIKTAMNAGYNYILFTYTGMGSTRVFNDQENVGDWKGYAKDLRKASADNSVVYDLADINANVVEMDETAGFSIIANDVDVVLKEFRFYKEKPEVGEDFTAQNLAAKANIEKWTNDKGCEMTYDETEGAAVLKANGNTGTYTFRNDALIQAKNAGLNAVKFTVKGGRGSLRLFASSNWGMEVSKDFAQLSNYKTYTLFFGENVWTEDSGITILASDGDVYVKEIVFITADPEAVIDYTDKNLASEEYMEKWSFNSDLCSMSYSEEEQALVLAANGNAETYNFLNGALVQAVEAGYNTVKFTVKGGKGTVSVVESNPWALNVKEDFSALEGYTTFTLFIDENVWTNQSGITILASEDKGGAAVYVKEIKFEKLVLEDLTDKNVAAKEYFGKWSNDNVCVMTYDETEGAAVLAANGNTGTFTIRHNLLKLAKRNGYNAVKFTVKGGKGSVRAFLSGNWDADECTDFAASENYTTVTLPIAHLNWTSKSGITILASEAEGGAAVYVKEIKFEKIEVSDEIKALINSNLVSKENMSKWVGDGTVEYDDEAGAMKLTFEKNKQGRYFDLENLWLYAKLLGKTKIVWTYADGYTDMNNDRLRIYSSTDLTAEPSVNVNGQGQKVDGGRAVLIETSKAKNEDFLALYKNKVSACNYILIADMHFE